MRRWVIAIEAIALATGMATAASAQGEDATAVRRTSDQIRFANYPPESMRRGEEGVVGVRVTTDRKGAMTDCKVTKTSGYIGLDTASCDMLLAYGRTQPFLGPDGRKVIREQDGQVYWQLPPEKRPAIPPPQTVSASFLASNRSDSEKVICHTQTRTGSLAERQKICMTASQWERQRRGAQDDLTSMTPKYQSGQ
ncbi:TonB family protein [Sphingomonas oligophenolica]|uniref:TonB family protein n=2 Tax=Sphingomonas oligophenolica TaxID=301154 RepID=A0A502CCV2_9SPHN|nr:TonB family protein [Sphingomonas oligophenolica]